MSQKHTQAEINNIVWKACDTFRGSIDPAQYKDYILTMLFLKYITDVWKDKKAGYHEKYKGDEVRVERALHNERFQVPEKATFDYLFEQRNEANKFAYRATFKEIEENDYNLNIPRYVETFEEEEPVDIPATQKEIARLKKELGEVETRMETYLKELGF